MKTLDRETTMLKIDPAKLSPRQRAMQELWEQHLAAEFQRKDASESCGTMTDDPVVNHVPVMTGGRGQKQLQHFYAHYFIPQMPPIEMVPLARTISDDRIIDEFVFRFTHTVRMDWLLPGIEPTGKRVEVAKVVVVEFRDGKIAAERIYWDQATVLVQLGLLDPGKLPVVGAEAAHKVLHPELPANQLIKRQVKDDLL
jgi:carboxymethylenebutenolidase